MKRGYRLAMPGPKNPRRFGLFVVVSRQVLIDSKFSTVVCAPVYSSRHGLSTEVFVGPDEGLRHDSSIHCDALVSVSKSTLTHVVGALAPGRTAERDQALAAALGVDPAHAARTG